MKLTQTGDVEGGTAVAPSRGRGLKQMLMPQMLDFDCRPFTGAWIETTQSARRSETLPAVAPSRGRGLKLTPDVATTVAIGRPFTGAWIETLK